MRSPWLLRTRPQVVRFSPPVRYRLSQAATSSRLRFICHLTPLQKAFSLLLYLPGRPPVSGEPVQGFPSYCKFPVNDCTLMHITGLTRYEASRCFARLPACNAESGSLTLCAVHFLLLPSDPAVTGNALAIRVVFPLIKVTPASCNRPDELPPRGIQKETDPKVRLFIGYFSARPAASCSSSERHACPGCPRRFSRRLSHEHPPRCDGDDALPGIVCARAGRSRRGRRRGE